MNLIQIYKQSLFIRLFEEKLDFLFKKGLINGTAHFCVGQEYIPVIVSQYLQPQDLVTSTHRGHGHALAKGLDPKRFLAELTGRRTGYNSGKGGSQHVLSRENNFYANGITGGMVPVATGMAFANKYKDNKNIVVCYLGDGGFNEGYVQEAFNLAVIWKLPILYVCENNQYAMSTSVKTTHGAEICQRIKGLGMNCESIEDNDYQELDSLVGKIIEKIRKTPQPYFIEVKTYRHFGHSKNDKNLYRDKSEEEKWFKTDVLPILENEIVARGTDNKEGIEHLKIEIQQEIEKIVQEVIKEPPDDISKIHDCLYTA